MIMGFFTTFQYQVWFSSHGEQETLVCCSIILHPISLFFLRLLYGWRQVLQSVFQHSSSSAQSWKNYRITKHIIKHVAVISRQDEGKYQNVSQGEYMLKKVPALWHTAHIPKKGKGQAISEMIPSALLPCCPPCPLYLLTAHLLPLSQQNLT